MLLPAWLAAMLQVPAVKSVTVEPLTLHTLGVVLVNDTGNPEVAVAVRLPVPFNTRVGAVPKLIVCAVSVGGVKLLLVN